MLANGRSHFGQCQSELDDSVGGFDGMRLSEFFDAKVPQEVALNLVLQLGHSSMVLTPLNGITGITKKIVMNRMPFLTVNGIIT